MIVIHIVTSDVVIGATHDVNIMTLRVTADRILLHWIFPLVSALLCHDGIALFLMLSIIFP